MRPNSSTGALAPLKTFRGGKHGKRKSKSKSSDEKSGNNGQRGRPGTKTGVKKFVTKRGGGMTNNFNI